MTNTLIAIVWWASMFTLYAWGAVMIAFVLLVIYMNIYDRVESIRQKSEYWDNDFTFR